MSSVNSHHQPDDIARTPGRFEVISDYQPARAQPAAIAELTQRINRGERDIILLGATGTGKSATAAWLIEQVQRPTLIMAPNKTLAAQLANELRQLLPNNAVEYFVSYYDYYQPEAYIAQTDTYIEKDSAINDDVERLRHRATSSLLSRRDVVVVSSVSCIYGLGNPQTYLDRSVLLNVGDEIDRDHFLRLLVDIQYERNDIGFTRGAFRVKGDTIDIMPAESDWYAVRLELFEKVNALGIGAQGLGGLTTVLDVKILDYPTHAASKPIAMIPNCAATRHVEFELDGSGPVELTPPRVEDWPDLTYSPDNGKRIDVDKLTKEEVASWKTGDVLLLNGKILTGRDAAHKRLVDMLDKGEELPVDFTNRLIYYVGPVDPVGDEVVGPAGPTTATRMDKFTRQMLEQTGLLGMIGKSERGAATCQAIADNKAVYLMAVGGAAYLVAKAIKASKVLAFPELGMEAIYEFEVKDMPVTVAVDSNGESVHAIAPKQWQAKIGIIPVEA